MYLGFLHIHCETIIIHLATSSLSCKETFRSLRSLMQWYSMVSSAHRRTEQLSTLAGMSLTDRREEDQESNPVELPC